MPDDEFLELRFNIEWKLYSKRFKQPNFFYIFDKFFKLLIVQIHNVIRIRGNFIIFI